MIKKISTLSVALLLSLTLFAQTWTGGVKGTVVNRAYPGCGSAADSQQGVGARC